MIIKNCKSKVKITPTSPCYQPRKKNHLYANKQKKEKIPYLIGQLGNTNHSAEEKWLVLKFKKKLLLSVVDWESEH